MPDKHVPASGIAAEKPPIAIRAAALSSARTSDGSLLGQNQLLAIIENSRSTDPALSGLGCGRIVRVLYALAADLPSLSRNTPRALAIPLGAEAVAALQGRSEQKSPAPAVHKPGHGLAARTWRRRVKSQ